MTIKKEIKKTKKILNKCIKGVKIADKYIARARAKILKKK